MQRFPENFVVKIQADSRATAAKPYYFCKRKKNLNEKIIKRGAGPPGCGGF